MFDLYTPMADICYRKLLNPRYLKRMGLIEDLNVYIRRSVLWRLSEKGEYQDLLENEKERREYIETVYAFKNGMLHNRKIELRKKMREHSRKRRIELHHLYKNNIKW